MKFLLPIVGILLLGIMFSFLLKNKNVPKPVAPSTTATPNPTLPSFSAVHLRSYQPTATEFTIIEDLGLKTGFHSYIVSYRSDNFTVRALLNVPTSTKPSAGFPVLIVNHGYIAPDLYRTATSYSSFASFYAQNGYLVVKPDYRGHDQSEGTPSANARLTLDYAHDVLNAIAAVKHYTQANPNKVGMLGHSMGGGISLQIAVASSEVQAVILAGGVVGSTQDFYDTALGKFSVTPAWAQRTADALVAELGPPDQNKAAWDEAAPITYAKDIAAAVQIIHGQKDEDVPVEFSRHLHEVLQKAGKPVDYVEIPGGDHNFYNQFRPIFFNNTLAFLDKYLK